MSRLRTSLEMRSNISAHQVLDSNDLMTEILLLLPPETVYNLILVSKRWLQIVSNPFFRQIYLTKWKPRFQLLGVFICKTTNSGGFKYELRSSSSCTHFPSIRDENRSMEQPGCYYLDSSDGLILFNLLHQGTDSDYHLWDRSAQKSHQLPPPRVDFESFSYKVIRADSTRMHSFANQQSNIILKVEIFSSRTNTWRYTELTCPEPIKLTRKGKDIGGVIYWYAEVGKVAIYDTNSKENRVDLIKLPKYYCHDERAMGSSPDGCLQYGRSSKTVMDVWKLEKVNGLFQWSFKDKLNFKGFWALNTSEDARIENLLLGFPIRNEAHEGVSGSGIWEKKRKKEKQGVPYGVSAKSCHSFDDLGLPFFIRYVRRSRVSRMIGRKLLRHCVSS